LKLCVPGTRLLKLFTIGAANEALNSPAHSVFMDEAFRKTNLSLVPSWEARNHFCTEMGQALRKPARDWR